MRPPRLIIAILLVLNAALPCRGEASVGTAALCPAIDFSGFSQGPDKARVPERMWWEPATRSYFIKGPELALRFLYPDPTRPLAEIKSDPAHVYQVAIDKAVSLVGQDACRPKIEISASCEMAAVPGAASQPAFVFTAAYYDECEQKSVQVTIRTEPLDVGGHAGISFSFYNAFRGVYDSGMDLLEGEDVVNMGYRLK
jgi:hypothetical protein